ncbi:hypothetical protein B0J11DRAFT_535967 [Dendryphion nanum]|uniref:F-box domain-containing protein n=1 Tax=Dendryphion nanum TaxID=256645 RepID=A0A9P9DHL2_9PLEO|nr:hypothetical protein B0J11DRAFT_535967 [Dendryphion nanum]
MLFINMASINEAMSKLTTKPLVLPHLPNELRIRIISYIDDPDFLWNTCRWVSPEFKEWSEETYARLFIPKIMFDIKLKSRDPHPLRSSVGDGDDDEEAFDEISYLLKFSSLKKGDASTAWFRPRMKPFVHYVDTEGMHGIGEKYHMLINDSNWEHACQMVPELELGLRPSGQNFVCPCRSLKAIARRGACKRYRGLEQFYRWNGQDQVFELDWKKAMAYVYSRPCPNEKKSQQQQQQQQQQQNPWFRWRWYT